MCVCVCMHVCVCMRMCVCVYVCAHAHVGAYSSSRGTWSKDKRMTNRKHIHHHGKEVVGSLWALFCPLILRGGSEITMFLKDSQVKLAFTLT